jgi:oligopeptide/dipeptide ABC transporter ATP-binding protein
MSALLTIDRLNVELGGSRILHDITFEVNAGEVVAIVGESGSGKTTLARAIAGLISAKAEQMILNGHRLVGLAPRAEPAVRTAIQMVFQNPDAALNPRLSVGRLIEEPMKLRRIDRSTRKERLEALLKQVGLTDEMAAKHPHQLSGGQRQRVCIARALAAEPSLLIADEALSALDVSIQSQIINLFIELKTRLGITYLFISHDLAVVQHIADRVMVLFAGHAVEEASHETFWAAPAHPYTLSLMAASPVADPAAARARRQEIRSLPPIEAGRSGQCCVYMVRCPFAEDRCGAEAPLLRDIGSAHKVACHFAEKVRERRGTGGASLFEAAGSGVSLSMRA